MTQRVAEQAASMLRELSVQKEIDMLQRLQSPPLRPYCGSKRVKNFDFNSPNVVHPSGILEKKPVSFRNSALKDDDLPSPSQSQQSYLQVEVTARTPYHRHSQSLSKRSASSHPRPSRQPHARLRLPKHVYCSANAILSKCQDSNRPGELWVPMNSKSQGDGPKMVALRLDISQPRTTSRIPHIHLYKYRLGTTTVLSITEIQTY
jgi:hypothetical protein